MSEQEYDWKALLSAAGITPPSDPTSLRDALAAVAAQGGGGGGITEIESTDGSITVTDPTGPTVDLTAPGPATAVLLGIGGGVPGAAQASYVNEGLASMAPIDSLFDGAPVNGVAKLTGFNTAFQALVKSGTTILAGTAPAAATFIGHDLNLIYRSTDGGAVWTGIATPWDAGLGSGALVSAIAFGPTASIVVAVGVDESGNAATMHSTDGGLTWANVTTPMTGITGYVNSVAWDGTDWYITNDAGIVAGKGLWSSPDLVTWTPLTTGLPSESVSWAVATSTVLMVGGMLSAPFLRRSTNSGTSFTSPTQPSTVHGLMGLVTDGAGDWVGWYNAIMSTQSVDNGATWDSGIVLPSFSSYAGWVFLPGTGWVTVWGTGGSGGLDPAISANIIYTAPVAANGAWTPVGYVPYNCQPPFALIPV